MSTPRRGPRAEAGVMWGELDRESQAFGLATTGGLVTTTGIAGFTLGGGIGWLMRKHGLAADNLIAADVITADGELVTASVDENPELLWGLRGGGGNFGIVTSFHYHLHPVGPVIYGGALLHPAERTTDLLCFYAQWTRDLPDELTTLFAFVIAPPEPFIPANLHGTPLIAVACCYAGPAADGEAARQSLRDFGPPAADVIAPIPYTLLQALFDATSPRGTHAYWKTEYLADLTPEAVDVLVDAAAQIPDLHPFTTIHIHHLEGAVAQQPPGGSAFSHRDPRFVLNIVGAWMDDNHADTHIGWVRDTWDRIRLHSTGDPYLNFLGDEGTDRVRAAYGDETFTRLMALKTTYDTGNLFQLNQSIPPEPEGAAQPQP